MRYMTCQRRREEGWSRRPRDGWFEEGMALREGVQSTGGELEWDPRDYFVRSIVQYKEGFTYSFCHLYLFEEGLDLIVR